MRGLTSVLFRRKRKTGKTYVTSFLQFFLEGTFNPEELENPASLQVLSCYCCCCRAHERPQNLLLISRERRPPRAISSFTPARWRPTRHPRLLPFLLPHARWSPFSLPLRHTTIFLVFSVFFFFFVPPQQPSPYIPSSVLSVPVVSASAGLPPAAPMTSFHVLSPPLPPSSAASQPYPAPSGPSPLPAYSLAPACSVSAPSPPSSVSVAPMSIAAPPAPLSSSFSDLPHRFTFDELNLPDLYASFKSLVKTMRERGGSQCE